MHRHAVRALLVLLVFAACTRKPSTLPTDGPVALAADRWTDLLDGSAAEWRGYQRPDLPEGWTYDRETRVLTRARGGGDIITRAQFTDFELELEWKIGPAGNSGVFFHASEATPHIYENAAEVQVLDNRGHPDGRNALTSAGSNFALHAATADVTRPVGEWNTLRLVVRGAHVEHWLNGARVVSYDRWTDDWNRRVAASKFAQWPSYGLGRSGHIGLQDHGDVVAFRHIRIRGIAR